MAGWIPSKQDNKDYGWERFGGSIVLREAIQLPNGDLATKFVPETSFHTVAASNIKLESGQNAEIVAGNTVVMKAQGAMGGAYIKDMPYSCRVTFEVEPQSVCDEFGLFIRAKEKANDGYKLSFSPNKRTVRLGDDAFIEAVSGLDKQIKVELILKEDIIDVCINDRRCIVNRLPERKGNYLWFYTKQGNLEFKNIQVDIFD